MNIVKLARGLIIQHEGFWSHPYRDTVGKLTIGYGTNLEDRGISRAEALELLDNDIHRLIRDLYGYPWFLSLSEPRRAVIIDMAYNLGLHGLLGFRRMIAAIELKMWEEAGKEMMDSKWAHQVGRRAETLRDIMVSGEA